MEQAPRKYTSKLSQAHFSCGIVAFLGALVSLTDWPELPDNLTEWLPLTIAAWIIAGIVQLMLAQGHIRTSVLDRQNLQLPAAAERKTTLVWAATNVVVLCAVFYFYWQGSQSILLLANQNLLLVSLAISNSFSLIVWIARWFTISDSSQS
ncbi:MAG: hypothetical protein COA78_02445 [Blastopirellula sp.]|nr:MAG: hypothetical protein COA78_02445 [Blastopirellula sp.]